MSSSTNDNNLAVDFWMESNGSKRKRFATRSTEKVTGVCSELTVQRLAKLRTFIEKKSEAMNLSELINVNSNIQTIENLCDLAMLIKDKEANIDCDSEGNVLVSKREEDASNCNETNKQMVLCFGVSSLSCYTAAAKLESTPTVAPMLEHALHRRGPEYDDASSEDQTVTGEK